MGLITAVQQFFNICPKHAGTVTLSRTRRKPNLFNRPLVAASAFGHGCTFVFCPAVPFIVDAFTYELSGPLDLMLELYEGKLDEVRYGDREESEETVIIKEAIGQLKTGKIWYWNDALALHHQMNGGGKSKHLRR